MAHSSSTLGTASSMLGTCDRNAIGNMHPRLPSIYKLVTISKMCKGDQVNHRCCGTECPLHKCRVINHRRARLSVLRCPRLRVTVASNQGNIPQPCGTVGPSNPIPLDRAECLSLTTWTLVFANSNRIREFQIRVYEFEFHQKYEVPSVYSVASL